MSSEAHPGSPASEARWTAGCGREGNVSSACSVRGRKHPARRRGLCSVRGAPTTTAQLRKETLEHD